MSAIQVAVDSDDSPHGAREVENRTCRDASSRSGTARRTSVSIIIADLRITSGALMETVVVEPVIHHNRFLGYHKESFQFIRAAQLDNNISCSRLDMNLRVSPSSQYMQQFGAVLLSDFEQYRRTEQTETTSRVPLSDVDTD